MTIDTSRMFLWCDVINGFFYVVKDNRIPMAQWIILASDNCSLYIHYSISVALRYNQHRLLGGGRQYWLNSGLSRNVSGIAWGARAYNVIDRIVESILVWLSHIIENLWGSGTHSYSSGVFCVPGSVWSTINMHNMLLIARGCNWGHAPKKILKNRCSYQGRI